MSGCSNPSLTAITPVITEPRAEQNPLFFSPDSIEIYRTLFRELFAKSKQTEARPASNAGLIAEGNEMENLTRELEKLKLQAAGIAHDFNNLLTIMVGNIELARFLEGESEIREVVADMESVVNSAISLTKQLSTLVHGTLPVREKTVLPDLLLEATRLGLYGSGVEARFKLEANLPLLELDRCQISQVITNLVQNAAQAMPGGGHIEVEAEVVEVPEGAVGGVTQGEYIEIKVRDYGTGISPEHLKMIFAPHFTTKTKGHGLGLSISYSNVRGHGGHIRVESEVGRGTTFRVLLPLRQGK